MSDDPARRQRKMPHHPKVRETVRNQKIISKSPSPNAQIAGFRGWRERGYVPHRDEPGLTPFITFRLADSFPAQLSGQWERLFQIENERERRAQLEAWLDVGHGACQLKDERIASMVAGALREANGKRYRLIAFTLMPNHVHVLIQITTVPLKTIVQTWKGGTARAANLMLGRLGQQFWQTGYWDTYMRDPDHEQATIRYIRNNPVKAGLAGNWKQWPWTFIASDT